MTWKHEKKYPFLNMVDFGISYIVQEHDKKDEKKYTFQKIAI